MGDTSKFKSSEFTINLTESKLDNAQYLMFVLMEKFKIKPENDLEDTKLIKPKDNISKMFSGHYGIPIGSLDNMYGSFTFYLNGYPELYTPQGQIIKSSKEIKEYLLGKKDIKELHMEKKAYIQLVNHTHPDNYYGIFYSLGDAIKVCSENDLMKKEEFTS